MEAKRKTIPDMHEDTRIMAHLMTTKLIEEKAAIVRYDELSTVIARDVRVNARGLLATARRCVERDERVKLVTVRNVGVAITHNYSGVADATLTANRLKACRTKIAILRAAENDTLSTEEEMTLAPKIAMLGMQYLFGQRKANKRIESKMREIGKPELPTAETLRLFEK